MPDSKRRRFDLRKLITDVVISPWAEPDAVEEISLWVKLKGFPASAQMSDLKTQQTPTLAEFRQHRHLFSKRPPELEPPHDGAVTIDELADFSEVIRSLTPERVRWLYKKRWDILRLNPGETPSVSDAQYLDATLRVLDAWKKNGIDVG